MPLHRTVFAVLFLVLGAMLLSAQAPTLPDSGPRPPCGNETLPSNPDVDKSPAIMAWDRSGLARDWKPPECTGWTSTGFTTLVAITSRFHNLDGLQGLLRLTGAVSALKGIRYWSTTHQRWQTLIVDAYALTGPTGDQRKDFAPEEMGEGRDLYFHQEDNLAGKAVYRIHLRTVTPDRLVFETENVNTIRYFLVTLFHPGEMQSIYFLDRETRDVWRYYSIARTARTASTFTAGHQASSINRAVALFRRFTGIPTDTEPPAAR